MERDLMTRTDRFGVEVRERVMWDIREGVVGSDTFIPKHVIMITWKNMSFAGGIDNSLFRVCKCSFKWCFDFMTINFYRMLVISRLTHSKWFWRPTKCTLMLFSIMLTSLGHHILRLAAIRREERAACPHLYGNFSLILFKFDGWLTLIAFI